MINVNIYIYIVIFTNNWIYCWLFVYIIIYTNINTYCTYIYIYLIKSMLIIQLSRGPGWILCGCASSVLMRDQSGVGLSVMKSVWNPIRTCHFLLEPSIFEKVSLLLEAYAGLAGKIMLLLKNHHVASYIRDLGHPNLCQNNYFLHLTSSHLDTSTENASQTIQVFDA